MWLFKNRKNSVRLRWTPQISKYYFSSNTCVLVHTTFTTYQNTKKQTEKKIYAVVRFDSGYRESCVTGLTVLRCLLLYEILRFPKSGNLPLTLCSFIDTITVSYFFILYIPLNKFVCENRKINRLAIFWYRVMFAGRVIYTTLDLTKCMGRFRIRNIRNGSRYVWSIYVSPWFDAPIRYRLQEVHYLHCAISLNYIWVHLASCFCIPVELFAVAVTELALGYNMLLFPYLCLSFPLVTIRMSCTEFTSKQTWSWQFAFTSFRAIDCIGLYLQSSLCLHGLVLSNRDHFTFTFFYLQACEYLPIHVTNCNAQKALEDNSCSSCTEIPSILWKWRSVTVFMIFRLCLYLEPYQWGHHPPIIFVLRSILILSSHLRLGLKSCLFTSGFVKKAMHSFLLPVLAIYSTYLTHPPGLFAVILFCVK